MQNIVHMFKRSTAHMYHYPELVSSTAVLCWWERPLIWWQFIILPSAANCPPTREK